MEQPEPTLSRWNKVLSRWNLSRILSSQITCHLNYLSENETFIGSSLINTTRRHPHALVWLEFICERVGFRFFCLFEKVSNLESILIGTVFYYLYDNSISIDLSRFKRFLHKIEDIFFVLWFTQINKGISRPKQQRWYKCFYIENRNYAQNVTCMSSGIWMVVDEYNC